MTATQVSTGTVRLNLTDVELAARLVEGDDQALAEVYRRHGSRVIAVADAVLRDRAAAEDVCHDVFVRLSRQPQRFDSGRGSLVTYLVVVAHGRAVDRLRFDQAWAGEVRRARLARSPENAGDDIWDAVSALPAGEAEALRLTYFGGTTYREVARILEVAEETVKSRIRSGMGRLRAVFVDEGIFTATQ